MTSPDLRIGELASRCGVSPHTIRFYERKQLLPRALRSVSRYRVYSADDERRVLFIRHAQALGLTLDDIRELVRQKELHTPDECRRVALLLKERIAMLDGKLAELRAFRRRLAQNLERCEQADGTGCPVVLNLSQPEAESRKRGQG